MGTVPKKYSCSQLKCRMTNTQLVLQPMSFFILMINSRFISLWVIGRSVILGLLTKVKSLIKNENEHKETQYVYQHIELEADFTFWKLQTNNMELHADINRKYIGYCASNGIVTKLKRSPATDTPHRALISASWSQPGIKRGDRTQ